MRRNRKQKTKGKIKHEHSIKCRSGWDKAVFFFFLFNLHLTTSVVGHMQGQHLELHKEISYAYIGYLCTY